MFNLRRALIISGALLFLAGCNISTLSTKHIRATLQDGKCVRFAYLPADERGRVPTGTWLWFECTYKPYRQGHMVNGAFSDCRQVLLTTACAGKDKASLPMDVYLTVIPAPESKHEYFLFVEGAGDTFIYIPRRISQEDIGLFNSLLP